MFRGVNVANMDAKGRIMLPPRHRACLQAGSILTIDTEERCLLLYPLATWEEIETKLAALPSFNAAARRIQRLLIGHATEIELDAQGRMLMPPLLRDYAGLDKRAVLVGQGKKIELWAETHWQESRSLWLKEELRLDGELPEVVKLLSL
jgi:MraZ protein